VGRSDGRIRRAARRCLERIGALTSGTLLPIAQYAFDRTQGVAELAVAYAVTDIGEHLIRVERRQNERDPEVVSASGLRAMPDASYISTDLLIDQPQCLALGSSGRDRFRPKSRRRRRSRRRTALGLGLPSRLNSSRAGRTMH